MKTIGRAVGAVAAAGALIVGGLFVGQAVFAAGDAAPKPLTASGKDLGGRERIVHADGTVTFTDGSTKQLSADLGKISAAGNGSVTLQRADGKAVTVQATDSTCVRDNRQRATLADLQAGERALVVQQDGSAVYIRAHDPKTTDGTAVSGAADALGADGTPAGPCADLLRPVHADLTVTFVDGSTKHVQVDQGMITNVGNGGITVLRRDGQSVTASYDDSTRVLLDCKPASGGDLHAGMAARVITENGHADRIGANDGLDRMKEQAGTTTG